jgi:hypothetical protein
MNSVWKKSRDFPKIDVHEFHLCGISFGIVGPLALSSLRLFSSVIKPISADLKRLSFRKCI